jgi:hypothetical protein
MALADLVVSLTAETAQFRVAMERAAATTSKTFDKMLGSAKTFAGGFAAYLSADALVSFTKAQIDAMDALDEMSQKVGIATDELSKLAYAAQFSGVDTDALQTALVKLSKASIDAATSSGSASDAFKSIGVSVKDSAGNLKSTEALIYDIADAFAKYEDGQGKVNVATDIFGKAGAGLIPMLNGGRKGLQDMGLELEKLGGVVMPQAAAQAAIFNDNLDKLIVLTKSAAKGFASELIPAINNFLSAVIESQKAGESFFNTLASGFQNSITGGKDLDKAVSDVREELDALQNNTKSFFEMRGIDFFQDALGLRQERIKDLTAKLNSLLALQKQAQAQNNTTTTAPKSSIPISSKDNTAENNAKKLSETIKSLRTEYIKLFSTKEEIAAQQAKELGANKNQIGIITTLTAAIEEATAAKEKEKKVLDILKQQNEEYNRLTKTQQEFLVFQAELAGAQPDDIAQIKRVSAMIDAAEKEKKSKEDLVNIIKSLQDEYTKLSLTEEQQIINSARLSGATEEQLRQIENYIEQTQYLKAAKEQQNKEQERVNDLQEKYKNLIKETNDKSQEFEAIADELLQLRDDLVSAGYDELEVNQRIQMALKSQYDEINNIKDKGKEAEQTYKVLGQTISSAFEDAIMQAKSYQDILNGILTDIARIVLRRTLTDPLQQAFEGYMSSVGFPSFTGGASGTKPSGTGVPAFNQPARANGGMVTGNNAYLVGERGAEIFVPNSSGTIIPNGRGMDGGGVAVNINNYSGQQVQTREVKDARGNRSITVQIGDVVAQEIARNGSNANMALRTTFSTKPNLVGR